MRRLVLGAVSIAAFAMPALAHVSTAPHEHPHAHSFLPSAQELVVLALLLSVAGVAAWAMARGRR